MLMRRHTHAGLKHLGLQVRSHRQVRHRSLQQHPSHEGRTCRFFLFVDGVEAGQVPVPGAGDTPGAMDGGAPLDFGDTTDVFLCARASLSPGRYFTGQLSQLAFWDVALTKAEARPAPGSGRLSAGVQCTLAPSLAP